MSTLAVPVPFREPASSPESNKSSFPEGIESFNCIASETESARLLPKLDVLLPVATPDTSICKRSNSIKVEDVTVRATQVPLTPAQGSVEPHAVGDNATPRLSREGKMLCDFKMSPQGLAWKWSSLCQDPRQHRHPLRRRPRRQELPRTMHACKSAFSSMALLH